MSEERQRRTPADTQPPDPDAALIDQHGELRGLASRLAAAQALLADYETRRASLKALVVEEEARTIAERQSEGVRGRRPFGPAAKKLHRLERDREQAEIDIEALPKVVATVRERLADHLRIIRVQGEPAAARFNDAVVALAD